MGIIKNKLNQATEKLATMDALFKMKKDLYDLGTVPAYGHGDVYAYGVKFFNIVAEFQDKYQVNEDIFKDSPEDAQELAKMIHAAGRDTYGMARAPIGAKVTLDSLYLGNIDGLNTYPASYWIKQQDKNVQMKIQNQLSQFVRTYQDLLMNKIATVLEKNKRPNNFIVKMMYKNKLAAEER